MKKELRIVLSISIAAAFLLIVLIFLATTRHHVPVHIKAKLSKLHLRVGTPSVGIIKSTALLQNLSFKKIEFTEFGTIELNGKLAEHFGSPRDFQFEPADLLSSVTFAGNLKITELVVGEGTDIEISPGLRIRINGNSTVTLLMKEKIKIYWEGCKPVNGFGANANRIEFLPHDPFIKVNNQNTVCNLFIKLEGDSIVRMEEEIPIADLNFMKERYDARGPVKGTTLIAADIMFPTLPDEKTIKLPEGSYLKIYNLKNFILKRLKINNTERHIQATIYGYTNDLKASYGRGEFTQLLPSSLILIRRNAALIIILVIVMWFIKTGITWYNQWNSWKGEN